MFRATVFALMLLSASNPALADEVTDTLSSAIQAYEQGDIQYAIEELDYAKQLLQELSAQELNAYLPEAPDGWARDVSEGSDANMGLAMIGGTGAQATYSNEAEEFSITVTADNPMVMAMSGMLTSAGLLGMKVERVGREKFINDEGELMGVVGNRILIQASGADVDVMIPVLEQIDFESLKDFGE
jgi:hypothetical protein